jgi:hypothetical protein
MHSWSESETHSWNESVADSQSDPWNDLPNANVGGVSITVRRSVSRSAAAIVRDGDNREAGGGEVGSDVLSFVQGDAENDD